MSPLDSTPTSDHLMSMESLKALVAANAAACAALVERTAHLCAEPSTSINTTTTPSPTAPVQAVPPPATTPVAEPTSATIIEASHGAVTDVPGVDVALTPATPAVCSTKCRDDLTKVQEAARTPPMPQLLGVAMLASRLLVTRSIPHKEGAEERPIPWPSFVCYGHGKVSMQPQQTSEGIPLKIVIEDMHEVLGCPISSSAVLMCGYGAKSYFQFKCLFPGCLKMMAQCLALLPSINPALYPPWRPPDRATHQTMIHCFPSDLSGLHSTLFPEEEDNGWLYLRHVFLSVLAHFQWEIPWPYPQDCCAILSLWEPFCFGHQLWHICSVKFRLVSKNYVAEFWVQPACALNWMCRLGFINGILDSGTFGLGIQVATNGVRWSFIWNPGDWVKYLPHSIVKFNFVHSRDKAYANKHFNLGGSKQDLAMATCGDSNSTIINGTEFFVAYLELSWDLGDHERCRFLFISGATLICPKLPQQRALPYCLFPKIWELKNTHSREAISLNRQPGVVAIYVLDVFVPSSAQFVQNLVKTTSGDNMQIKLPRIVTTKWHPRILRYVLLSTFKRVAIQVFIQFLHKSLNHRLAFHVVLGNLNMLRICSYGIVLSVSLLTINLTLQPLYLVQIAYFEVGYNNCSDKVELFPCRHVLATDSIDQVAGEALLNVREDVYLFGHYMKQSYISFSSFGQLTLTLDIHRKPCYLLLHSKMHFRHHEGWRWQVETIVSVVNAYHLAPVQASIGCGNECYLNQQSSSHDGKSIFTSWPGYLHTISPSATMPWDPGGVCRSGLRASRNLRGRECHGLPQVSWALSSLAFGLCVLGRVD